MADRLAKKFGTEDDKLYENPPAAIAFSEGIDVSKEELLNAASHFEDFFEEVFLEFIKFGEIVELVVADNIGEHMLGNTYVKFAQEEQAETCFKTMNGKYYNNSQIHMEYSPVTDFREACCRQYAESQCERGGYCNFIHPKFVDLGLRKDLQDHMYKEFPDYWEAKLQRKKDRIDDDDFAEEKRGTKKPQKKNDRFNDDRRDRADWIDSRKQPRNGRNDRDIRECYRGDYDRERGIDSERHGKSNYENRYRREDRDGSYRGDGGRDRQEPNNRNQYRRDRTRDKFDYENNRNQRNKGEVHQERDYQNTRTYNRRDRVSNSRDHGYKNRTRDRTVSVEQEDIGHRLSSEERRAMIAKWNDDYDQQDKYQATSSTNEQEERKQNELKENN